MPAPRLDGAVRPGSAHAHPAAFVGARPPVATEAADVREEADADVDTARSTAGAATPAGALKRKRRALVCLCALGGSILLGLVAWLAAAPHLSASWRPTPQGRIQLAASDEAALAPHVGQTLSTASAAGLAPIELDARLLHRSARWMIDDADRARQQAEQAEVARLLQAASVTLAFADGSVARVPVRPRGVAGLSLIFWLLCAFGGALFVAGGMALGPGAGPPRAAYAAMAGCQALNLVWMAVEATPELGVPPPFGRADLLLRMALDLATAAAMVSLACHHPRRLPGARWIALAVGAGAVLEVAAAAGGRLPQAWWWLQGSVAVAAFMVIALLTASYRLEMNPYTLVLRRFGVLVVTTWVLLTAGLASSRETPAVPAHIADLGSMVWYVFLASLLLLAPVLARSPLALREFALLAAISTVATSLDLLFVSVCGFSPFASLTLALFLAMVAYSLTRHWLTDRLRGEDRLTTEHLFEQLYRAAREGQTRPERTPLLFARLLGDLFQPLEIRLVDRPCARTRVAGNGATLLVPTPVLATEAESAVLMRFAQRGQRLFSAEDARLTDRIGEQLRRAVHFDQAVEHGRHEERLRLAQDLHDDIGARLLTMMYQAKTPEMGDYVRHTLQDLKTLTRGLAASSHRLSHAAAEWKADLTHRLTAAHVEVHWSFVYDEDILLSVGQWSALTRVLRELVSNAIAHSQTRTLAIDFRLEADRVSLRVTDDGVGVDPAAWSPGLGLGGVRKRVRQLGGSVEWQAAEPRGIRCQVVINALSMTQH